MSVGTWEFGIICGVENMNITTWEFNMEAEKEYSNINLIDDLFLFSTHQIMTRKIKINFRHMILFYFSFSVHIPFFFIYYLLKLANIRIQNLRKKNQYKTTQVTINYQLVAGIRQYI